MDLPNKEKNYIYRHLKFDITNNENKNLSCSLLNMDLSNKFLVFSINNFWALIFKCSFCLLFIITAIFHLGFFSFEGFNHLGRCWDIDNEIFKGFNSHIIIIKSLKINYFYFIFVRN